MSFSRSLKLRAVLLGTLVAFTPMTKLQAQEKPYQVALVESVFAGQNRAKVVEQIRPFAEILQKDTDTKAKFDVYSLEEAEKGFAAGDIQLVILTGLEYGWIKAKNENARALVIASIDPGATRTAVIANQKDSANDLKALVGKKLAIPERLPFLNSFYVQRQLGKKLEDAFTIQKLDNVDETIEAVVDGKAEAGLVTAANLETFKERKPGRYRRLKVVHESPEFPPATVMFSAKSADQDLLNRFEKALLRSADQPEGQRVLTLYKLKGFEKLPPNFDARVKEIVDQFPEKANGK